MKSWPLLSRLPVPRHPERIERTDREALAQRWSMADGYEEQDTNMDDVNPLVEHQEDWSNDYEYPRHTAGRYTKGGHRD